MLLVQSDEAAVLLTEVASSGDNDVLHTSETPIHNVRPIEKNSLNPPQQVGTMDHEINLLTTDAISEIGTAGSLFDQILADFKKIPPQAPQHASTPLFYQGFIFLDSGSLERPR